MQPRSKRIAIALVLLLAAAGLTSFVLLRPRVDDPRLVGTWSSPLNFAGNEVHPPFLLLPDGTWKGGTSEIVNIESHREQTWRVQDNTLFLKLRLRPPALLTRLSNLFSELVLRRDLSWNVLVFRLEPTPGGDLELREVDRFARPGTLMNGITVDSPRLRMVRWDLANQRPLKKSTH